MSFAPGLIDHLPPVRGHYIRNAPLARHLWFRVGGEAEILFEPVDTRDLSRFLRHKPSQIPVTVIGAGSNILVRDGGIPGVVIRLKKNFTHIKTEGQTIIAGGGVLAHKIAKSCQKAALSGLEFLIGIPGTIGGALRMNAGAYGQEMKNVTLKAEAVDESGNIRVWQQNELGLRYRGGATPETSIFTSVTLRGQPESPETILKQMHKIQNRRKSTQPITLRTGGSTFTNPPQAKAWKLIDQARCRGLKYGQAQVSEHHCNFLVNTGKATAEELETLGETVRQRVQDTCGVCLEWEIRRIGIPALSNQKQASKQTVPAWGEPSS